LNSERLGTEKLIKLETQRIKILAFSIGGTIAWKYGLKSANIDSLICISSTRHRKETEKPKRELELYFSENDEFKPKKEWLGNMMFNYNSITGKDHHFYIEPEFTTQLSETLLKTTPQQGS